MKYGEWGKKLWKKINQIIFVSNIQIIDIKTKEKTKEFFNI